MQVCQIEPSTTTLPDFRDINIKYLFASMAFSLSLFQVYPPCGGGPPITGLLLSPIPLQPYPGGAEEAGHPVHLAGARAAAAAERKGQVKYSFSLFM